MDMVHAFDENMRSILPGPVLTETLKTLRNEKDKLDEELAMMTIDPLRRLLQPAIGEDLWNIGDTVELWKHFRIAAWTLIANIRSDQQRAVSNLLARILIVTMELMQGSPHSYPSAPRVDGNIRPEDSKSLIFESINLTINERQKRVKPPNDSFLAFIKESEAWK